MFFQVPLLDKKSIGTCVVILIHIDLWSVGPSQVGFLLNLFICSLMVISLTNVLWQGVEDPRLFHECGNTTWRGEGENDIHTYNGMLQYKQASKQKRRHHLMGILKQVPANLRISSSMSNTLFRKFNGIYNP